METERLIEIVETLLIIVLLTSFAVSIYIINQLVDILG